MRKRSEAIQFCQSLVELELELEEEGSEAIGTVDATHSPDGHGTDPRVPRTFSFSWISI